MTDNRIRYIHFMSGVLATQQDDPLCSRCKAFANTVARTREALADCQSGTGGDVLTEVMALLDEARSRLDELRLPEDAVGQKKAGNCKLPEGVCFVKVPKKIGESL
ncbi:MAG: hypothetical protein OHK006_24460 [Thermodesulfovibrionales bacterium]